MSNNYLAVILFSVLSITVTNSCVDGDAVRQRVYHSELQGKTELVVAMDIGMPGYFALEGGTFGYHYDVLSAYAEKIGAGLRIITGKTTAECRAMLDSGEADIIATLTDIGDASLPLYTTSYMVLAGPGETKAGRTARKSQGHIADLKGKRILMSSGFKSSNHYDTLLDSLRGTPKFLSENDPMELVRVLSNGDYDFLICEKSEALLGLSVYRNVQSFYEFPDGVPVRVSLNEGVKGLQEDFTSWLEAYRAGEEYSLLDDLYMEQASLAGFSAFRTGGSVKGPFAAPKHGLNERISQFDDVIRKVAREQDLDWRFLSAIAYHESRFKPHVVSPKGAQGIMQIMPVVARHFNVPQEMLADTETNVMLAAKLLKNIEKSMKLPEITPYSDRMSIVLACYNAGVGHIADARRLARKHGRNMNCWSDVSHFLQLKAQPEYYGDDVVRNGVFRGSKQTLAFVNNVMGKYNSYCILAQR